MSVSPNSITIAGPLSYPTFTHAAAVERNAKGNYPTTPDKVAPDYNILLDQVQLDKLTNHLVNEFLPWAAQQHKDGVKAYEKFDARAQKKLLDAIQAGDWEDQPPYLAIKPVNEKTQELVPDAVASLKVVGTKGQDIKLMARVNSPDELAIPDENQLTFPCLRPVHETTKSFYAGCIVVTTLSIYAYVSGKLPGFGVGGSTLVFKKDGTQLGGAAVLDEDAIFED